MNPLSALRSLAVPAVRPEPMIPANLEAAKPKSIPFTELEKLSPGILPLPNTVQPATGGFEKMVTDFVGEVTAKQAEAANSVNGLMSGQNVSLHQTMIAMEEASISFQLMVEVRNKLLESYQELMRMQV
ncbi:MAG TPA: flagellar hook-basal body complex protein FliE [Verrucomicrobiae bacterium]|nr:flagellar hook-basal body complex protein FliE [Verrucomicrobiae bacterium]